MQNGFQFSGNPFVDGGLAVMTHLAGKKEIADLTLADIKKLVSNGSALTRDNLRLKSFTMVFGTNGVLTQHAYKKIGKNEVIYKAIVKRLVNATENDGKEGVPCELTGIRSKFNFQEMCASALKEAGRKSQNENGSGEIGYLWPEALATMPKPYLQLRAPFTSAQRHFWHFNTCR